jgi:hypothetical protein
VLDVWGNSQELKLNAPLSAAEASDLVHTLARAALTNRKGEDLNHLYELDLQTVPRETAIDSMLAQNNTCVLAALSENSRLSWKNFRKSAQQLTLI